MSRYIFLAAGALYLTVSAAALAQNRGVVTCSGILIEVDMDPLSDYQLSPREQDECKRCGYFPRAVVYDNDDDSATRTCVLDVGPAGHWPLRGACWRGERCTLTGPYFKRIGDTYYMRLWDKVKASAPGHPF